MFCDGFLRLSLRVFFGCCCVICTCRRADAAETFCETRGDATVVGVEMRKNRAPLLLFSVVAPPCTGWRGSAVVGYAGTSNCYCDRAAHEQRWPLDRPILKIGIAPANNCKTANINIPCLNHDVEGRGGLNPANRHTTSEKSARA